MRSKLLITTAALWASVALAAAQNTPQGERGTPPGASGTQTQERGSQGERDHRGSGADSQRQGQRSQQTESQSPARGQAQQDHRQHNQGQASGQSQASGQGQASGKEQERTQSQQRPPSTGQAGTREESGPQRQGQDRQRQGQQDQRRGADSQRQGAQGRQPDSTGQREGERGQQAQPAQGGGPAVQHEGQASGTSQQQQSQQGTDASGRISLTADQRTRIQETVVSSRQAPRVDRVDFSLTVGTTVPASVHVMEVPSVLVDIHPEWRGHTYFIVRDEIVIVDRSRKLVAVVPVGPNVARSGGSATTVELNEAEIREVQIVLIARGYLEGQPDGIMGSRTRDALVKFQQKEGLQVTGTIDTRTVASLGLSEKVGRQSSQGHSTTGQEDRSTMGQEGGRMGRQGAPASSESTGEAGRRGTEGHTGRDQSREQRSPDGRPASPPAARQGGDRGSQPGGPSHQNH